MDSHVRLGTYLLYCTKHMYCMYCKVNCSMLGANVEYKRRELVLFWILDTGYWIPDTGYWILDTIYWILDTGYCRQRDTFSFLCTVVIFSQRDSREFCFNLTQVKSEGYNFFNTYFYKKKCSISYT